MGKRKEVKLVIRVAFAIVLVLAVVLVREIRKGPEEILKKEKVVPVSRSKKPEIAIPEHDTREWHGYHSGITTKGIGIIKDSDFWQDFWNDHTRIQTPSPEVPEIDFDKEMVIALFIGEKPTGGYSIEIVNTEKLEDKILVNYKETTPEPDAVVTQAFTQPYHMIVIEKSDLTVTFKKID